MSLQSAEGAFSDDDEMLEAGGVVEGPTTPRRRWIADDSAAYAALRWAYQPLKALRRVSSEAISRPRIRQTVDNYLAKDGFKGLHVGCGPFLLAGWLNSDLAGNLKADIPQDITRRFPIRDEGLDAIYACEVIEHLPAAGALNFMREAYRTLRDGGVIRLTTPDVVECCRLFLGLRDDVKLEQFRPYWREGRFSAERWINGQFRSYGHQHLFSFEELSRRLGHAGFRNVVRCAPQESASNVPELKKLETRYGPDAPPWIWCRTLIVEAVK